MSTLGKSRLFSVSSYLPEQGDWRAEMILEQGDLPAFGATTLTISDLSLATYVTRTGFDGPDRPSVVVMGAPGWQKNVTRPISFQSDSGVRLSTVLDAIATGAGHRIEKPTDTTIGSYYEIVASRAGEPVRWCDALNDLVKGGFVSTWRVDPDGITRFVPRVSQAVSSRATVIGNRDQVTGRTTYGIDSAFQFLPGNTVEGNTIGRAVIREISNRLEVDIYVKSDTGMPSVRDQIRRMVSLAFEDRIRTYVVSSVHVDGRLDLSPPSDAQHLPDIRNAEQWVLGGIKMIPALGDEVIVVFRDEKKTRPIVIGFKMGPGPFSPIARVGDLVQIFFPPSMPITGTITPPGSAFTGVLTIPGPGAGTIQIGSPKTGSE